MTTSESEKRFKADCHRKARATQRRLLHREADPVHFPRKMRDVTNPWNGPKDGKTWFGDMTRAKNMNDPAINQAWWRQIYQKLLRK